MVGTLSRWLNVHTMSTGRRLFVFAQMHREAEVLKHKPLLSHLVAAQAHDRQTLELEAAARARTVPSERKEAASIDAKIDRTLGALNQACAAFSSGMADTPSGQAAQAIVDAVFPDGVVAITLLNFVDQLAKVDQVVAMLEGPLRKHVHALSFDPLVNQLKTLNQAFGKALCAEPTKTVTQDQVRSAAVRGQEYLLQAVALALGTYYDSTDAHANARGQLLRAVSQQCDALRDYRSSRRRAPDVDPDTGAELPPADPIAVGGPKPQG